MTEATDVRPATNAVGQSDDEQRDLILRCRTRKEACVALGLSAKSLGALDKRCMRLGIKPKWLRLGDVQAPGNGQQTPVQPQQAPVAPVAAPEPSVPAMPALKALEAVVVILRTLPDAATRRTVAETAARIAS